MELIFKGNQNNMDRYDYKSYVSIGFITLFLLLLFHLLPVLLRI